MLIITEISNKKTNELIIYRVLCRNVIIFYQQELTFLFQVQENLESGVQHCFIAHDSHVKIVWLHVVVFSEDDILHF